MPFVDATPLINDADALRARAAEDGFLFFRGLLPVTEVTMLEQELLALCHKHGLLDAKAVDDRGRIVFSRLAPYYTDAYKLRPLHALPKHPAVLDVYRRLFGREPLPHARVVLRTVPHGTNQVWPAHQDMPNIATHDQAWNTWLPVGHCPQVLGAISIAPGSHKYGLAQSRRYTDNDLVEDEAPDDLVWASDDLEAGDVVMFNGLTFHRGEPNRLPGRPRLSIDNCIQPADTEFVNGAFDLHHGDYGTLNQGLSWPDIYAGWDEDDPLKYYWRDLPIEMVDPLKVPVA